MPDKLILPKWVNETAVACISPGGWGSGTKSLIGITFNLLDFKFCKEEFNFF